MQGPTWVVGLVGAVLVVAFVACIAVGTGWAALDLPISHTKASDWDYQLTLLEACAQSWRAGVLPVWNPWTAGGVPLLANPESPALHPLSVLAAWVHPATATRVSYLLHMGLWCVGTLGLARRWGAPALGLPVAMFALLSTDVLVWRMAHGHTMMSQAAWIPVALWALTTPHKPVRGGVLAGLSIAAAAHGGGHYPAWMAAAVCMLWTVGSVLVPGSVRRRDGVVRLVTAGLVGGLVAAPKLVPVVLGAAASARLRGPQQPLAMGDFGVWDALGSVFVHSRLVPLGEAPGLHEGLPSWFSPLWAVLALVGVAALGRRRPVPALVVAVAALVSMGHNLPVNAFGLLHGVPPLDRFRNPERWAMVWVPMVAALSAVGLGRLPRVWQVLGLGLCGLTAAWSAPQAMARTTIDQITEDDFQRGVLVAPAAVEEPWRTNLESIGQGERCRDCSDALMHEAPPGLGLGPWTTEPAAVVLDYRPGRVVVVPAQGGPLVVPEWAAPGWQATDDGGAVVVESSEGGLVQVAARAGVPVTLRFVPPGLGFGLGLGLLGLGLALVLGWRGDPVLSRWMMGRTGADRTASAPAPGGQQAAKDCG